VTCEVVVPELIGFHFGILAAEPRGRVEAHLLDCGSCLRTFLALKHDLECPADDVAPSAAARDRLRRAVVHELEAARARPRRRWEAPLALAIGATAALVAVLVVQNIATGPGAPPRTVATSASMHPK
jgi:hypothetical protein